MFPNSFRSEKIMSFPCPPTVRQYYGKLSETALRAEIEKALDHPAAEATQLWNDWRQWLVAFSIHALRPTESVFGDEIKLCRWVAFALRYLHPLGVGKERPQSAKSVIEVINNSSFVVSTLLFGSEADCLGMLQNAFDHKLYERIVTVDIDRQAILRGVQYRSSEEKTARNWSDALLDPLKVKVTEYFHSVNEQVRRELSVAFFNSVQTSVELPSTGYHSQLEQYVRLGVEKQDRLLYIYAVDAVSEFSKRMELLNSYASQAKWGIPFVLLIIISLAFMSAETNVKAVLISVVAFNGFTLFYGRVFNYLRETFAVVQAALQMLEIISDNDQVNHVDNGRNS